MHIKKWNWKACLLHDFHLACDELFITTKILRKEKRIQKKLKFADLLNLFRKQLKNYERNGHNKRFRDDSSEMNRGWEIFQIWWIWSDLDQKRK